MHPLDIPPALALLHTTHGRGGLIPQTTVQWDFLPGSWPGGGGAGRDNLAAPLASLAQLPYSLGLDPQEQGSGSFPERGILTSQKGLALLK